MIKFQLETPILLETQMKEISEVSGISQSDLFGLAYASKAVLTEDCERGKKGDILSPEDRNATTVGGLTGMPAVLWIAEEYGCPQKPLTEINIPLDVYDECTGDQWAGLSVLAARVLRRSNRLARFKALKCPEIFLDCETMMLAQEVWCLENNDRGEHTKRWDDGLAMRSLNDVGYSLLTGWDADKLEVFARREKELQERLDAMMYEDLEDQNSECNKEEN